MTYQEKVKWAITPGLAEKVRQFEAHCRLAIERKYPILVLGDTGVGKSLFMKIFKHIYEEEKGVSSVEFTETDFNRLVTIEGLCNAIRDDKVIPKGVNCENKADLAWINQYLSNPDLFDRLKDRVKKDLLKSVTIKKLIALTANGRCKTFETLTPTNQRRIKKLNRIVIETLYPDKCPKLSKSKSATKVPIIKEANCSHFSGSDPNVARAELFGSEKGVITGVEKRNGLITQAKDGLLILEEIGELPHEVQAMLLTFIETGKYRTIGGKTDKEEEVFIVGSTNRHEALREDFFNRFFPFYIPSLHERRGDVLYYLANEYPELMPTLHPWEILSLLTYHWPGNVREVEKVGRLLIRNKMHDDLSEKPESIDQLVKDAFFSRTLWQIEEKDTSLKKSMPLFLRADLESHNVDVGHLDAVLDGFHVGLDPFSMANPFKDFQSIESSLDETLGVKILGNHKPFNEAFVGFQIYCLLFFQYEKDKKNLFNVDDLILSLPSFPVDIEKKLIKIFDRLDVDIFLFLTGLTNQDFDDKIKFIPTDDRHAFFKDMHERYPNNEVIRKVLVNAKMKVLSVSTKDIFDMTEDELLKMYYRVILKRTDGNVSEAARIANVARQTLKEHLSGWGMLPKKRD